MNGGGAGSEALAPGSGCAKIAAAALPGWPLPHPQQYSHLMLSYALLPLQAFKNPITPLSLLPAHRLESLLGEEEEKSEQGCGSQMGDCCLCSFVLVLFPMQTQPDSEQWNICCHLAHHSDLMLGLWQSCTLTC